jgi:pimeloyl-ACP methyl ester carboxylesterase
LPSNCRVALVQQRGKGVIVTTGSPPPLRILTLPDGRRVACAEYGDPGGLPVLALHGTPGSRLMFALADRAARERGVRLIAPERPGYGLSDYRHSESLAQIAEDLSAVADLYEVERFAVIGVSGGGPYAVAAAAAMPDRISLLALVAPIGEVADVQLRLSRFQRLLFRRLARRPWASRLFFGRLRLMVFRSPDTAYRWLMRRVRAADRELLARSGVRISLQAAMGEGLRPGVEGVAQDLRLCCSPWRLRFADIDVPAIIWQGSDDPVVPPEAAYALARALPNCRLDVIPAAGHYWVFSRFGLILDAVAAVLRADAAAGVATPAEPIE